MRWLIRGTAVVSVLMLVASCTDFLKKKDEDAGAITAAVEPLPAVMAVNQGNIARFPDEKPLTAARAPVKRGYSVREAPPSGAVIGGVAPGSTVTQLAVRGPYTLILFDNPNAPGTQLMGWVHHDAFSVTVADAGTLVCSNGESPMFSDAPICLKPCASDAECVAPLVCKGDAFKLGPGNSKGAAAKVCVTPPNPAPQPQPTPVVDAGKPPAVVDAGKPPAVVDAGPPPIGPAAGVDVVAATGGKCPINFVFVTKTGKCHRGCPLGITGNTCNAAHFCIKCNGDKDKVCGETREQCK